MASWHLRKFMRKFFRDLDGAPAKEYFVVLKTNHQGVVHDFFSHKLRANVKKVFSGLRRAPAEEDFVELTRIHHGVVRDFFAQITC